MENQQFNAQLEFLCSFERSIRIHLQDFFSNFWPHLLIYGKSIDFCLSGYSRLAITFVLFSVIEMAVVLGYAKSFLAEQAQSLIVYYYSTVWLGRSFYQTSFVFQRFSSLPHNPKKLSASERTISPSVSKGESSIPYLLFAFRNYP